jgi:hypothetical protein
MDASLVNALGTLGFGGGVAVAITYFYFQQFKIITDRHKEMIDRLCESQEAELKRVCESFDSALAWRDRDIVSLVNEIRTIKSGTTNG